MKHVSSLTGLRFVAASYVLLFHSGASFSSEIGAPEAIVRFLSNGYMGVSLFFVLSGFILCLSYAERGPVSAWLRPFIIARIARIYPVYLLAMIIMFPFVLGDISWIKALLVLSMTQAWTSAQSTHGYLWIMQAWTLSIELFFYTVFPFLLYIFARVKIFSPGNSLLLCSFFIVFAGSSTIAPGSQRAVIVDFLPLIRLLEFVFGMSLWMLISKVRLPRNSFWGEALTYLFGLATLGLLASTSSPHLLGFVTLLIGCLISCLYLFDSFLGRLLSSKIFIHLGEASYALYLLLGPIREWIRLSGDSSVALALYPIISILTSVFVYKFYEAPMRTFLKTRLSLGAFEKKKKLRENSSHAAK